MTNALSIIMLLGFLTYGCGLGTEVGNGARDKGQTDKKSAGSEQPSQQQSDDVNDVESGGGDSNVDENLAPADYTFDVSILLNGCASPFAAAYDGRINLRKTSGNTITKISGSYDDDTATWSVKDSYGKALATIVDDDAAGDFAVSVKNPDGSPLQSDWSCGTVESNATADGFVHSVTLTKDDQTAQLAWTIKSGVDGAKDQLQAVTVTPDTAQAASITFD